MTVDIYTPWREPADVLEARHVGRESELGALQSAVQTYAQGRNALPIYLFGPRGSGKSHLLALLRGRLEAQSPLPWIAVPEDIPILRTAQKVFARCCQRPSSSLAWGKPPTQLRQRRIVLFEGFDRQLYSMSDSERKRLRALLLEEDCLLIATGVLLDSPLTDPDEAFMGFFEPWPVNPVGPDEAAQILRGYAESAVEEPTWDVRERALIQLAGGSVRTLVALARSCAESPKYWVADQLHSVLRDFTAHYQMRFRDLPPQAQQVVSLLAMAPKPISPTLIAPMLDVSPVQAGVILRRLYDIGVVTPESKGRSTRYALSEPLFRFWLEYRTAPWEQTRVAMTAKLLEMIGTPVEVSRIAEDEQNRLRESAQHASRSIDEIKRQKKRRDVLRSGDWEKVLNLQYNNLLRNECDWSLFPKPSESQRLRIGTTPYLRYHVFKSGIIGLSDVNPRVRDDDIFMCGIIFRRLENDGRRKEAVQAFTRLRLLPVGQWCPKPYWMIDKNDADDLCAMVIKRILSQSRIKSRIGSWVGWCGEASDNAWKKWLEVVSLVTPPVDAERNLSGLIALRRRRPKRFAGLYTCMPSSWDALMEKVDRLAHQLEETGPLHSELEALKAELEAGDRVMRAESKVTPT